MEQVTNAARCAGKAAAALAEIGRRPRRGVVVLLYHRVGAGSGLQVDLPAARFEEQVAEIASRATTLGHALAALAGAPPGGRSSAVDPVVVSFDDGTADFVDVALPILVQYRVPAVLYVATAFIDEQRDFPAGGRPLSWSALADAVSTGLVTVGSHTHAHALLDRLAPGEVEYELDRSVGLIAEHLGVEPEHFAYPKAVAPAPNAEALVRSRFASAALAGTRPNLYGATDPHRIARSPIQVADGMVWFRRKLAGGLRLEDDLRRLVNRRRYAGATS